MRRALSLTVSAALLAVLTACSSGTPAATGTTTPSAQPAIDICSVPSGTSSDAVSVTGAFGAKPTVTFQAGLAPAATERTTVIPGTGDKVSAGSSAQVAYSIYNGTTGALIESYGYDAGQGGMPFAADATKLLPGLAKAIGCETVGSRVAAVIPGAEAWGPNGNESVGVTAGQSLVAVIDIKSLLPSRAWGADQPAPDGLPKVTLAADGTPSVAVPSTAAPADLRVAVLKKGDGKVVPSGASVTVHYLGVDWATGQTFDKSWGGTPGTFSLSGVVPGFAQAVTGQTAGSQVLVVVPPALGYGDASADNTSKLAGKTLVFVIDILAVN